MSTTLQPNYDEQPAKAALSLVPLTTAVLVPRQSRGDDGSKSIEDQVEAMTLYCERQGWAVGETYPERDVSGRRPLDKRPGLKRAVEAVESGRAQVLLTCYFDRLARSVATRAEAVKRVEKVGGSVVALDVGRTSDATAAEKLSGTLLAAIAEFYADQIGEKMKAPIQRNIDLGIAPFPNVTPAYRKREDGTLELDPERAPLIREAVAMRLAPRPASYTTIARFLTERGVKITPGGVEGLFASKLLVGEIHFGSFRPNLRAIEKPLLDAVTFRRLNEAKARRGRYAKSERLLARLDVLICRSCGARLSVDTAKRGPKAKEYSYYRCGNRLCVAPAVVSAEVAEEFIRDEAIRLSGEVKGRASLAAEVEAARLAKVAAEEKLAGAIRTLAGLASETATREVLDELQATRDRAAAEHDRLAALTTPDRTVATVADWDRLTLDERRDVIRAVIERAVVTPGRGAGRIAVEGRTVGGE
jgi:DNA invertase Pin-like site-specific DNA recombinase